MRFRAVLATLACGLFSLQSFAYQPKGLQQLKIEIPAQGSARQITGQFYISNVTENTFVINMPTLKSESYSFSFAVDRRILKAGEQALVKFSGYISSDGKWQINAPVEIYSERQERAGTHLVDLYFLVKGNQFFKSSYADLFLKPEFRNEQMGDSFYSVQLPNIPQSQDWRLKQPMMEELLKMDPRAINEIPTKSGSNPQFDDLPEGDTIPDFDNVTDDNTIIPYANVAASGNFSWIGMDNMSHPAFGWRVRAWRQTGSSWNIVAEDWIQWNGNWSLSFPQTGGQIQFQYVAFNRFFKPQNSAGDTYRWVGPARASVPLVHNEGSWNANTSTGNVRGLGEIYREGMTLWSKLFHSGGIDPLRANPINVYFPNTTYDCGDGSGNPWSCANTGGNIWLIPSHASRNGVMQHELGHQINYQYWNNQRPPNSGGSHSLGSCATEGLALLEGFANFIVFWTQADRASDPNAGFDFRAENPSFACATDNRNESWVAATLWDLHDSRADSSDNLWFVHMGATPGIYLRSGIRNSMALFHPVYRNAANAEHRTIIDNIFRQNNIIP